MGAAFGYIERHARTQREKGGKIERERERGKEQNAVFSPKKGVAGVHNYYFNERSWNANASP